jgi:NADPH-ferrihemoprotein reductase
MLTFVQDKDVVVFFGSQSGKSERYANSLARECHARYGIKAMAADLDDYDHKHLSDFPADKIMVFIVATYGEGDPTDNANTFNEYLLSLRHKSNTKLASLKYFACGLGNSNYRLYNRFVDFVDDKLTAAGAERLGYIGKADEAGGATATEETFREWKEDMLQVLAQKLGREERAVTYESGLDVVEIEDPKPESPDVYLGEPNSQHLTGSPNSHIGLHNPYAAPIAVSRELFTSGDRNCIHMEFDISGAPSLKYRCGDHLAVWPVNPENEVERLISVLGWDDRTRHASIDIRGKEQGTKIPIPTPTTRETVLRYYLEICGPVSRDLIGLLNDFSPSPTAKSILSQLYKEWHTVGESLSSKYLNVAKLLQLADPTNPWTSVPLTLLIEAIPKLQPRYYSIASSPTVAARRPAITAVVTTRSPEIATQDRFHGVATHYLLAHHHNRSQHPQPLYNLTGPRAKLAPSKILIHIRASTFKLPANPIRPIIMIGAGTGIAPFRGFVQERAKLVASGKAVGKVLLFFGCRSPHEDFLYQEEWAHYAKVAPLEVVTAFSRYMPKQLDSALKEEKKAYVQQRLLAHSAQIVPMLFDEGAYVYVCGAARMAQEVRECLVQMVAVERGWEEEEAREWLERELKASRRLQEDVWGG